MRVDSLRSVPSVEQVVPFSELSNADLVVDQLYDGGTTKTMADDPLARSLPVGNQGGFRYAGSPRQGTGACDDVALQRPGLLRGAYGRSSHCPLISGRDIVQAISGAGYNDIGSVRAWLAQFA